MYKRILVGTDGSNAAEKAVDHAIDLCKDMGAELIAVSIVNLKSLAEIEQTNQEVYHKVQSDLEKRANEILDNVEKKASSKNVKVKKIMQVGDPAEIIVELAKREKVDLAVVGTKGLLGAKRLVLGSTAEKIVRWASVPVLVVR
ncbi:MAG: universal stress protein [Candidatus Jordarchaeaceae archaeon]